MLASSVRGEILPGHFGEDGLGLLGAAHLDQPARAFRNPEEQQGEGDRGQGAAGKHPAPADRLVPGLVPVAGDEVIDEIDDQDAADNGDLVDGHQASAQVGRGDFGDIHRRGHGGDADADAAQPAEQDEGPDVARESGADGGGQEEQRRKEQRLLAPEPVRDGPDDQHAGRAADQHATGRPAFHHHIEIEANRQELDGAGNNARVVAEEQPAQRGDQADGDEVGEVGAHRRRRSGGRRCGNWHGRTFSGKAGPSMALVNYGGGHGLKKLVAGHARINGVAKAEFDGVG